MNSDLQLNSTEKVIWLLKRLGDPPYELGLTELANELGCAKSGVYKILNVLLLEGFVCQHYETKKYCLGPAIHKLGLEYDEQKVLWNYAEPIVTEINNITQESVYVCVRHGDTAIVAYGKETRNVLRLKSKLGALCPINAGSMGKLMAAFHDSQKIKNLLATTALEPKTANTIVDPQLLLSTYDKIRSQGYSTSFEENCIGAGGIAAPIWNKSGKVIAGLSISAPRIRFTEEKLNEWTRLLIWGAKEISHRLGHQPSANATRRETRSS